MNKRKSFFGIYLIVTFAIIVTAIIMALTLGINLGSDIGGGTQFEVTINSNVASKQDIEEIKQIVKNNNESVETIFVEDKLVDTVIVVRIADKKIEKQVEIKNQIIKKLELENNSVSSFEIFNGSVTNRNVLHVGIALVCILLFIFVAGWIRYQIVAGLSLVFTMLHTLMLMVSLLIVTRLPLTLISVMIMLILMAVVLFVFVLLLERIRANSKLKHNENISTEDLVATSEKAIIKPAIFLGVLALVVSIALICIPVRYVILTAVVLFVCLLASAYSFVFVGVPMHERLLDLKIQSDKMKLSRNSSPAPSKKKETNKNKDENK